MATPALDAATFGALVDALKTGGRLAQTAAWLHLPEHRVELSADDRQRFARVQDVLAANDPNNPPRVRELARTLGVEESAMRGTLVRLASLGELYRVAPDHYFLPTTVRTLARIAGELAITEGVARAAPFRDRIGVGRKVAIQILEFFDRIGYTRRIGDDHRVIQPTMFED
jgi:selenocysteine-specific elongation factor